MPTKSFATVLNTVKPFCTNLPIPLKNLATLQLATGRLALATISLAVFATSFTEVTVAVDSTETAIAAALGDTTTSQQTDGSPDETPSETTAAITEESTPNEEISNDSSEAETASETGIVDFQQHILPLLRDKCQSCHQGENPKGSFLVLDRETVLGYISPGDSSSSSLWTDYLVQPSKVVDKESLVMPPDGPLSATELATLKLWMDEGAVWPEEAPADSGTTSQSQVPSNTQGLTSSDNLSDVASSGNELAKRSFKAFGYLHPALVHFPIALIILSGVCAFLSYFLGSRCEAMAFHLLWIGTIGCIFSSVAGWSFAETRGYTQWAQFPIAESTPEVKAAFIHRWLGILTTIISMVAVVAAMISFQTKSRTLSSAWRLSAMGLAALVSYVGHKGGELVYGDILLKIKDILAG